MRKPELRDFDRVGRLIELAYWVAFGFFVAAVTIRLATGTTPAWLMWSGTIAVVSATIVGVFVIFILLSSDLLELALHRLAERRKRGSKNRPSVF